MNKVSNGSIARVVRTISYVLVLLSSFTLGVKTIVLIDWNFINTIFDPINSFISSDLSFLNNYLLLLLLIGFLGLVWTQSKNLIMQIITTVLLISVSLIYDNVNMSGNYYLLGKVIDFLPNIGFINDLLATHFASFNWLGLVVLILPLLFVYIIVNSRRPKRMGLSIIVSGLGFLMLALGLVELPSIIGVDWLTKSGYKLVINIDLVVSYTFLAVGSTLGIIGFFRK